MHTRRKERGAAVPAAAEESPPQRASTLRSPAPEGRGTGGGGGIADARKRQKRTEQRRRRAAKGTDAPPPAGGPRPGNSAAEGGTRQSTGAQGRAKPARPDPCAPVAIMSKAGGQGEAPTRTGSGAPGRGATALFGEAKSNAGAYQRRLRAGAMAAPSTSERGRRGGSCDGDEPTRCPHRTHTPSTLCSVVYAKRDAPTGTGGSVSPLNQSRARRGVNPASSILASSAAPVKPGRPILDNRTLFRHFR